MLVKSLYLVKNTLILEAQSKVNIIETYTLMLNVFFYLGPTFKNIEKNMQIYKF